MRTLYQTRVTTEDGRAGHVRSADGTPDLPLSLPHEFGGTGGTTTNPGQLFAVDYAACFENAILHVARGKQIKLASTSVTITVGINPWGDDGFVLTVSLPTTLGDVDQAAAETLVVATHGVYSYSHAVRGNIDVRLNTVTR